MGWRRYVVTTSSTDVLLRLEWEREYYGDVIRRIEYMENR